MIDLRLLIKAGVHFGHQKTKWNPKMEPYIWGHRNGVHLIDVSKTAYNIDKAAKFLEDLASQRKQILFVGTKKSAQEIVGELARKLDMPYINHRWVGGILTNYSQVKKSVTKLLHYEDILAKSEDFNYTKKELNLLQKNLDKLKRKIGGIRKLSWPIGAIVVVDVKKEETAIKEAAQSKLPIVALVDTNSDPSLIDYVIPCNDDSPKSIAIILDYLGNAIQKGKEKSAISKLQEEEQEQLEVMGENITEIQTLQGLEEEETEEEGRKRKKRTKAKE